ncbi:MAG: PAS domain-containing protein [Alphaproteobacteria bacterium]|nr:PAS domain-containing protein [Alphaproteobacteria bacterium]
MKKMVSPSGRESAFGESEIIVSKTDLKGRITYANDVFCRVAHMDEEALLGAPHSIIRHPDMPRSVFKLLWDTLWQGQEIFAYVLNLAANGDHYWVFAHVTPSRNGKGEVVGYHSNRRKPDAAQIAKIVPIYNALLKEERAVKDPKEGLARSFKLLESTIAAQGMTYDEFIFTV